MKRAKFAKQKVEIFKPSIDTRYSDEEVVSHDQNSIRSTPIESSGSLLLLASDIDVVGIDEAQFFDKGLVEVCNELANRGIRVIVAGYVSHRLVNNERRVLLGEKDEYEPLCRECYQKALKGDD